MTDAAFTGLLRECEGHVGEARAEAALRAVKAMAGDPAGGERVRRLGRDAIELLAQLVDAAEARRSRRATGTSVDKERQEIDAAAFELLADARSMGAACFSGPSIAAARIAMDSCAVRGDAPARRPKGAVFISYRRSDTSFPAGRLNKHLRAEFGADAVFMDIDSIPLGIDFRVHIVNILTGCRACLVLIGDEWLDCGDAAGRRLDQPADLVRIEVETALRVGIPVVPLLVGAAAMPTADRLPETIADLAWKNGLPLRPDPDFEADAARITQGLRGYVV